MDTIPAHYLDDELMGSPTRVPEPPADDTHSLDGPHGEKHNGGDGVSEQNMEKPDKSWMSAKRSPPHATVGENFPLHPDQNEPVQHDGGKKGKVLMMCLMQVRAVTRSRLCQCRPQFCRTGPSVPVSEGCL